MGYPILSVTGFAAPAELGSAMETLCGQVQTCLTRKSKQSRPTAASAASSPRHVHPERHWLCGAGGLESATKTLCGQVLWCVKRISPRLEKGCRQLSWFFLGFMVFRVSALRPSWLTLLAGRAYTSSAAGASSQRFSHQ